MTCCGQAAEDEEESYHSKAVPAQEAATTVRIDVTGMESRPTPSTTNSAIHLLPLRALV